MIHELTFTAKGKNGPTVKKCKELYAEAREMTGGDFDITRMVRTGAKYQIVLDNSSSVGLSLEQFTNKLTR